MQTFTSSQTSPAHRLWVTPLGLLGLALLLRVTDIFVLRLDERLGEISFSLVQVQSATGELQPAMVMSVVAVFVLVLLAVVVEPIANRLALPRWEGATGGGA